jgi:hypothetical protein
MLEVIGAFVGGLLEGLVRLFFDGLCYALGLVYLWIKNKGRKPFGQIRKETVDLSEVGKAVATKGLVVAGLLLLVGFWLFAFYIIFKHGLQ